MPASSPAHKNIHPLPELLHSDRILILDFGSQVTQLIARRVRESGVYCEIWPFNASLERIRKFAPKGLILSGSPASVLDSGAPHPAKGIFDLGLPVLGICYGQQYMCHSLGGRVEGGHLREFGKAFVEVTGRCALTQGDWKPGALEQVWMSHGDRVTAIPEGFEVIGKSEGAPFAMIADEKRRLYGVQFHPEVVHTPRGAELLRNFIHKVAGCSGSWSMAAFRDEEIRRIREKVGKHKVICGLSGGVDSAVAARLVFDAIGDQLTCIFVDTGLLRKGEADQVTAAFRDEFGIPLVHVKAGDLFLEKLAGVSDPEEKRKIIGRTFIEVFEKETGKLGDVEFLAQGTLYPDVIESVSFTGGPSATIKSHHNVGGLPECMKMRLLEPLRELFKDEVRLLGRELGISPAILDRHPFPGPGLAIRIPGEVSREKVRLLQEVDAIFLEELRRAGLYDEIWQAFVVLLPVRTVGVMGDARTYEQACALRAVTSTDGMTADIYPFPFDFLSRVAGRIVNEVRGINRVTYDITSKPPGTIEWE